MRYLAALLSVIALSVPALHAQPISFLIDDFDNTDGVSVDPVLNSNGIWTGYGPGITNVLGGHRVLGNYQTNNSGSGTFSNKTRIEGGVFSIDNPSNTRSSGQVIWQGNANLPGTNPIISHPASTGFGLGGIDFDTIVSSPNFYFQWSVSNSDFRIWTYVIRAYTTDENNYFEGSITVPNPGPTSFTGLVSIARSNFTSVGSPDWTNIDAISFSASYDFALGGLGGDLELDFMQISVPEMSTYLMIGCTFFLCGAVYVLRMKKVANKTTADETKPEVDTASATQAVAEPVLA
ncbi:MAG: hypothetical protein U0796_02490 [Gemmatales bacterium]